MRYAQLKAFHHVAIHRGFSRAAEALGLTQPAISDQVRKLELEYDLKLFERQRRQVALTEAGETLLEITHRLFESELRAREFLTESLAAGSGTLRVIADSAHHFLPILGKFRQTFPDVFVSVEIGNSEDVLEALTKYRADIGIMAELPQDRAFNTILLHTWPIVAFAAKTNPAAQNPQITIREMADYPLVMREKGSKTRAMLEEEANKRGVTLNTRVEAEGREAVFEIVAASDTIGVVSEAEFGNHPDLVKIPISGSPMKMNEALVCLEERKVSKLVSAFMKVAQAYENLSGSNANQQTGA